MGQAVRRAAWLTLGAQVRQRAARWLLADSHSAPPRHAPRLWQEPLCPTHLMRQSHVTSSAGEQMSSPAQGPWSRAASVAAARPPRLREEGVAHTALMAGAWGPSATSDNWLHPAHRDVMHIETTTDTIYVIWTIATCGLL